LSQDRQRPSDGVQGEKNITAELRNNSSSDPTKKEEERKDSRDPESMI